MLCFVDVFYNVAHIDGIRDSLLFYVAMKGLQFVVNTKML